MTFFSLRRTYPFLAVSVLALGLNLPAAASAEQIKYLSDPVYEKMAPEDPHPMEDLVLMGEEGDARAQFILGDLYGKGKGGLPRNIKKSREWFEKSARGGYAQSFIRLAALEKRVKKPEDAYKWYTLAIDALPSGERKWAQTARDALAKEHSLTAAQIKSAAVRGDLAPERRRTEGIGDTLLSDRLHDLRRVDGGGARRIDLGHDGRHAERGVEQREDRQHRQVHLAGPDAVGVAHEPHLGVEHAMLVTHALGRAGGAGGEEDGGQVGGG